MESIEREVLKDVQELQTDFAVMETKLSVIENYLKTFVTRPEFTPVKMLVYGMATSILAGVVGAILSLVIHNK